VLRVVSNGEAQQVLRLCKNSKAVRTEHGSFAFTLKVYG